MRTAPLGMVLLLAAGCGVGAVSDDTVIGDDDTSLPANALCESTLTLSGSFAPEGTPPTADMGCVPMGTWTVQVTVADVGDCDEAPVSDSYVYTVTGEGADQMITYTGVSGEELSSGIHSGGNGQCEGSFEHVWAAGNGEYHVAQLSPYFAPGTTTMLGSGTYQLWSKHP